MTKPWPSNASRFLLCAGVGTGTAQRPGFARDPIFHFIDVRPYGVIRLGAPFDSTALLGVPLRPGVYRLDRKDGRPVQLGDTRAILVARTPDGQVCALLFLYAAPKTLGDAIADYESGFGPHLRMKADSAGAKVEAAKWRDGHTRLQVRPTEAGGISAVTAILEDDPPRVGCP